MFLRKLSIALFALSLVCAINSYAQAQSSDDDDDVNPNEQAARQAVQRLANADPLLRQQAAEELARLSANEQQKMVQGYYMQEKNSRVKLALAWALYRMTKSEMLFPVVRDLDSSRAGQAAGYLRTLDEAEPLYMFLSNAKPRTQVELLKVLADIGNQTTLAQIKPLTESYDPKVSVAAQRAAQAINDRLANTQPDTPQRPRQVGQTNNTAP
jgi:molybdopterin-guanine dinucleotide biosynthesis protein A